MREALFEDFTCRPKKNKQRFYCDFRVTPIVKQLISLTKAANPSFRKNCWEAPIPDFLLSVYARQSKHNTFWTNSVLNNKWTTSEVLHSFIVLHDKVLALNVIARLARNLSKWPLVPGHEQQSFHDWQLQFNRHPILMKIKITVVSTEYVDVRNLMEPKQQSLQACWQHVKNANWHVRLL